MVYSEKFKSRVLTRMLSPGAPSVGLIANEVGVHVGTLYRWRRDSVQPRLEDDTPPDDTPKARSQLTPLDKVRLLVEASTLTEDERGAFLRRHGLRQIDLDRWQSALDEALDPT